MRNQKLFKAIALPLLVLMFAFSGCSKDDTTGKVKIVIRNPNAKVSISIYPAENENCTLYYVSPTPSSSPIILEVKLNVGNYFVLPSSSNSYSPTGFQVRSGKTTTVTYGDNGGGKVNY